MCQFFDKAMFLKELLQLQREPVGVKFLKHSDDLQSLNEHEYEKDRKMRYCQALMLAGQDKKILLGKNNLACAAAGAAFGFMPLHPKLASGEGHFNTGVFSSLESAARIMNEMPRLQQGEYDAVAIGPLGEIDWEPDVIVIEAQPEAVMWLSLAEAYQSGQRLQFSTSVVQATCVDATVVPFSTGRANGSFGCTGCREATDLAFNEALIGLPGTHLDDIINNLKDLQEKVIPKNRSKPVYKRFMGN